MDAIARVIVRHSHRILAATAVVTLAALLMLFRMDFNGDVASFVLEGNETGETFKALQDKYSAADPINVVVSLEEGKTFESKEGLSSLFGHVTPSHQLRALGPLRRSFPKRIRLRVGQSPRR